MKYISYCLISSAVLAVCACGASQNTETANKETGDAKTDIVSDIAARKPEQPQSKLSQVHNATSTVLEDWDDGLTDAQRREQATHIDDRFDREFKDQLQKLENNGVHLPTDVLEKSKYMAREVYGLEWAVRRVYRPQKDQIRIKEAQKRIGEINAKGQKLLEPYKSEIEAAMQSSRQDYSNKAILQRNGETGTVQFDRSHTPPQPTAEQLQQQRKNAREQIETMAEKGGVTLSEEEITTYLDNNELIRKTQSEMIKAMREVIVKHEAVYEIAKEYHIKNAELSLSNQKLISRLQMARFTNKADEVKQEAKDNFRRGFEGQNYSFSEYDLDQLAEINLQVSILRQEQASVMAKWQAERGQGGSYPPGGDLPEGLKDIQNQISDLNSELQTIISRIQQTDL